jgi:hypothetical protein
MDTPDFTQTVTILTYGLARQADLADTPATAADLQPTIAAWMAAGGATGPGSPAAVAQGMGSGLELIGLFELARLAVEALLAASMHLGLHQTFESMRHWRTRLPGPVPELALVVSQRAALQHELQIRLQAAGLPEPQAHQVADMAVAAVEKVRSAAGDGMAPQD